MACFCIFIVQCTSVHVLDPDLYLSIGIRIRLLLRKSGSGSASLLNKKHNLFTRLSFSESPV